ncbi:hypothetical protein A2957_00330 [Candidatus Roizmanbacteria bacterium RIFCSPLOWO2_01_FULL_38_11]|uniref:Uncharacterized protein n=1 Tax=Candidatus Roizmanbacteria bacterium RIFCSPLOWO2_01_FULL_38_11 TaxID=1802060 RepID=A0A1F7IK34_9BACT|nr:MAG: hypothetical protein A2957_00330 [Candidatus Roizmanbacteria bacterium RIFCSPLOWO2_01_FULL_38_11]
MVKTNASSTLLTRIGKQTLYKQHNTLKKRIAFLNEENHALKMRNIELEDYQKQIRKINDDIVSDLKIRHLTQENEDLRRDIQETQSEIKNLEITLKNIKTAKFFRVWQAYTKIREGLLYLVK